MFGNLAFMQGYLVYLHKQAIIQAKYTRKHVFKLTLSKNFTKYCSKPIFHMAKPFFTEDWEKWTHEELSRARSRLAGFIEATPDKDKLLREVSYKRKPQDI